jgi:hypothetical protein
MVLADEADKIRTCRRIMFGIGAPVKRPGDNGLRSEIPGMKK